jgi:hypothetical protein
MKKIGLLILTLFINSPDLSIIKIMVNPLKRKFHTKKFINKKAGIIRFIQIWEEKMS